MAHGKNITYEERLKIKELLEQGCSQRKMAKILNVAYTTINREYKKNKELVKVEYHVTPEDTLKLSKLLKLEICFIEEAIKNSDIDILINNTTVDKRLATQFIRSNVKETKIYEYIPKPTPKKIKKERPIKFLDSDEDIRNMALDYIKNNLTQEEVLKKYKLDRPSFYANYDKFVQGELKKVNHRTLFFPTSIEMRKFRLNSQSLENIFHYGTRHPKKENT